MKKIVFFSDWKHRYRHPTPQCAPFVEVPFADRKQHEDADAYVQINIKHPFHVKEPFREPFYDYIDSTNKPRIVFESAVFRQNVSDDPNKKYYRFAWNSFLRNEANFGPSGNSDDRWKAIQKQHQIEIKPWRHTKGKYILIVLQHVIDTSLFRMIEYYGSYYKWLYNTISRIRATSDIDIVIRPHPKHGMYSEFFEAHRIPDVLSEFANVHWSSNQGAQGFNGGKYLQRDLDDAQAVVGWTSNALTEAVCYGIPVYAMSPGAMAYPMGYSDLSSVDDVHLRRHPDRQQWLNDLAYSQWTFEEIANGTAWNHIKNANIT